MPPEKSQRLLPSGQNGANMVHLRQILNESMRVGRKQWIPVMDDKRGRR
jgi:hypothetical protein